MSARIAVLATLLATVTVSMAQVHRWVDERGAVQYGDRPPGAGATQLRVPVAPPAAPAATAEPAAKPPTGAGAARQAVAPSPAQTSTIDRKLAQQAQQQRSGSTAPPTANTPGMRELIARCKANRGVDCDTPQGMRALQRENTPITDQEQSRIAGLRARQATCAKARGSLGC